MSNLSGERDEAAYQFAKKLALEGRLPRNRGKGWGETYAEQMRALREEFDKEQRDAGKTNL